MGGNGGSENGGGDDGGGEGGGLKTDTDRQRKKGRERRFTYDMHPYTWIAASSLSWRGPNST